MAYYVDMLASRKNDTLYIGVTRDLVRRTYEDKGKFVPGFTTKYGVDQLVWYEVYDDPTNAITREKELKKWRRAWKVRSIEEMNPIVARALRGDRSLNWRHGFRARR
jgi:putative endonuclease